MFVNIKSKKFFFNRIDFSANQPYRIFLFQILAFAALVYSFYESNLNQWLITFAVYFLITFLGGTITFHRLLSHKSFQPYKWFSYVGPILGSLMGAGSTIAWVANHRQHHQHTDKINDPHSPQFQPWYRVQWGSMFHKPSIKFAIDLLRSPFHLTIHRYYWLIHFTYAAILYLISADALIYAYLAPASLAWNAGSSVNVLNHYKVFGYRNFNTPDSSVNNPITGLLVGGEGYHNNHHGRPQSYTFSQEWYEFDISAFIIRNFLAKKIRS